MWKKYKHLAVMKDQKHIMQMGNKKIIENATTSHNKRLALRALIAPSGFEKPQSG
jgi:hypothetical protein